MQQVVPHHMFDRLVLALTIIALVVPITYLEVTRPTVSQLRSFAHSIGMGTTEPAPAPAAIKTQPVVTPKTHAVAKTPVANTTGKTATTNSLVHLRAGKSVQSANIVNLDAGTSVELRSDADATWQGVRYQGKDGYIYRDYLQY